MGSKESASKKVSETKKEEVGSNGYLGLLDTLFFALT